ncbi:hypothetical protein AGOR_G00065650 [Albula goreensis]|uniref:Uncharacterized protein n=1 Tax=Albula goreensis TaxID=1534307 RepID=A0A8T3DWN4_9TELE|nr:hypothetical protein AGOR_G00065650 [Albula goreensis]
MLRCFKLNAIPSKFIRDYLPVRRKCRKCENRHANRCELDEGDKFAAKSAEEPLVSEVPTGIHRCASEQQEYVSKRKARHEQTLGCSDWDTRFVLYSPDESTFTSPDRKQK